MPSPNLKSLIGKLNDTCRKALESAESIGFGQKDLDPHENSRYESLQSWLDQWPSPLVAV